MKRLLFLALLASATAHADPAADEAAHVQNANDYYKVGNFEGALAEYHAAYALDPKPEYLYAMATIEDQRGGCEAAIDLYQQFIATHPPAEDISAAQSAIDACKKQLGVAPPPPPPPPHHTSQPPSLPASQPPPPPHRIHRGFLHDRLGDTLAAAGVVGVAGGAVLYVLARGAASDAEMPLSQPDYDAKAASARHLGLAADIAGGVGAALIVGGVIRWVTADRWQEVPVAPMVTTGDRAVGLTFASRW